MAATANRPVVNCILVVEEAVVPDEDLILVGKECGWFVLLRDVSSLVALSGVWLYENRSEKSKFPDVIYGTLAPESGVELS